MVEKAVYFLVQQVLLGIITVATMKMLVYSATVRMHAVDVHVILLDLCMNSELTLVWHLV